VGDSHMGMSALGVVLASKICFGVFFSTSQISLLIKLNV
jgi:hypothetical protein